jgi:hypothetical protein
MPAFLRPMFVLICWSAWAIGPNLAAAPTPTAPDSTAPSPSQSETAEPPSRGQPPEAKNAEKPEAEKTPKVPGRNDAPDRTDAADRIREGTRWQNERGVFTLVGDRVTFTPNSHRNQNFVVLENLNLERIVRTIEENRTVTDAETLEWNIDGTVTEFRGANFVIVTRSVLIARPRSSDTGR